MYCRYSFLYEEKFSYNQVTRPPRKIEKWQFCFLFTRKSTFFVHLKKYFLQLKYVSFRRSSICFCSPKIGNFSSFVRLYRTLKRPLLPLFKMLSFLDCLFGFLHRFRPHAVLVVDGVEHQVDMVMAVFNPTTDKFRTEFFSAVQIYDFTIYCKSALEFLTKGGKNISVRTLETQGTPKITTKGFH